MLTVQTFAGPREMPQVKTPATLHIKSLDDKIEFFQTCMSMPYAKALEMAYTTKSDVHVLYKVWFDYVKATDKIENAQTAS